jgi:general stress protein 26
MKLLKKHLKLIFVLSLFLILTYPIAIFAQDDQKAGYNRDSLLQGAREMISDIRFCALISLDEKGHPQARTMDPFLPDANMVVWFGTNINSRKIQEIKNNSKATLYYQAENGRGYVVLKGDAYWENDPQLKLKYWKPEWEVFYSESRENYTLIRFVPFHLEIVDYKHNIVGDSATWEVPNIELK